MKSRITVGTAEHIPPVQIRRTWDIFPDEMSIMPYHHLPIKQLSIISRVPILYVTTRKDVYPNFKWEKVWK